jgi:outer membrane protein OmpA-like peptidoglycan-associated protein
MTTAPGKRRIIAQADGYATVQKVVTLLEGATLEQTVVLAVTRVVVTAEKIELKESVYFETGKAAILDTSFAMLSEVAGVLVDHPEITLLRVEGHTDSRGSASSNKRLSQARADSVREYLEGKGVDGARLKSVGYGEEKPIDDRNNAEGWTRNRRVDLFIEERSDD